MLANDVQIGDTLVDADGNVIYTVLWEPIIERTTVWCRVQWALDGGMTDRTLPLDVDIPRLVRPAPPEEPGSVDPPEERSAEPETPPAEEPEQPTNP